MLSEEMKREMLEDARSIRRRDDFRSARNRTDSISFEEYLFFLNRLQELPCKRAPEYKSQTKFNKL